MSLICLVAGLILYSKIENQIPSEFSFFKKERKIQALDLSGSASLAELRNNSYINGWYIKKDNLGNFEFTKAFETSIMVEGNKLSPPELIFTCYEKNFYVSLNTRIGTNFYKKEDNFYTDIDIKFDKSSLTNTPWLLGKNNKAFYEDKMELMGLIQAYPMVNFNISYAGEVKAYAIDLTGLTKLLKPISECEPQQSK